MNPAACAGHAELEAELAAFVAYEARLLDEGRFDEWIALFADDGHYWLPAQAGQTDPRSEPSIAFEDLFLLRLRVERLRHPQAHSQQPASRCLHLLQSSRLVGEVDGAWLTSTPFLYIEQRGAERAQLAGTACHRIARLDGTLRIRLKRVDVLGVEEGLPMIQLFP